MRVIWCIFGIIVAFFPATQSFSEEVGNIFNGIGMNVESLYIDKYKLLNNYMSTAFGGDDIDSEKLMKLNKQFNQTLIQLPLNSYGAEDDENIKVANKVYDIVREFIEKTGVNISIYRVEGLMNLFSSYHSGELLRKGEEVPIYMGNSLEISEIIKGLYKDIDNERYKRLMNELKNAKSENIAFCVNEKSTRKTKNVSQYWFIADNYELDSCVYRLLFKTYGMRYYAARGLPSILSEDSIFRAPTELDWRTINLHFRPEIKNGMEKSEVEKIAGLIIEEMYSDIAVTAQ